MYDEERLPRAATQAQGAWPWQIPGGQRSQAAAVTCQATQALVMRENMCCSHLHLPFLDDVEVVAVVALLDDPASDCSRQHQPHHR